MMACFNEGGADRPPKLSLKSANIGDLSASMKGGLTAPRNENRPPPKAIEAELQ